MSEHDEIHADITSPAHWLKDEWKPTATVADTVNRTADLTRQGYCKWHGGSFSPGGHWNRESLVERGICEHCEFWLDLWIKRDAVNVARINGKHYILNDADDTMPAGMYGRRYIIRFDDNRGQIVTTNLWHQGTIPVLWRNKLPDNAKFVTVQEPSS